MQEITLDAQHRPLKSKGKCNSMRQQGSVPAIFYGQGRESISLIVNEKEIKKLLRFHQGNRLVNLRIDGKEDPESKAIIKEIQRDVIGGNVLHVDFQRISMDTKIRMEIPIEFTGEPAGVKAGEGVLQILQRTLLVECLPKEIPEKITVDISDIRVGHSLHVRDLNLPGIMVINNKDEALATVTVVREEEAPVAAPAEGEAAPLAEPELVDTKGKKEEEPEKEEKSE